MTLGRTSSSDPRRIPDDHLDAPRSATPIPPFFHDAPFIYETRLISSCAARGCRRGYPLSDHLLHVVNEEGGVRTDLLVLSMHICAQWFGFLYGSSACEPGLVYRIQPLPVSLHSTSQPPTPSTSYLLARTMPPSRLYVTSTASPSIYTPTMPYSSTRRTRHTRSNTFSSSTSTTSHHSNPPSPIRPEEPIITPRPPAGRPTTLKPSPGQGGHQTTPSFPLLSPGLTTGSSRQTTKRIRSKKLQAKLANNAFGTGFEENVAACILIELR
jgi:hypothetical protein